MVYEGLKIWSCVVCAQWDIRILPTKPGPTNLQSKLERTCKVNLSIGQKRITNGLIENDGNGVAFVQFQNLSPRASAIIKTDD